MDKKKRGSIGSITVEATISLTAFMFMIITLLNYIDICIVQERISVAINTTAKEISQYSYLYGLTGFNESTKVLSEATKPIKNNIKDIGEDISSTFNEIQKMGDNIKKTDVFDSKTIMESWEEVLGSAEKINGNKNDLTEKFKEIAKDPKSLMFGIAKLVASEGLEEGKSKLIAAPLSKVMIQKHLKMSKDGSTEKYLKNLGIIPSANGSYIDGLDFGESTLFAYGSNQIKICVKYKVKLISLLPIVKNEYTFVQTAITNGWLCGDGAVIVKDGSSVAIEKKKTGDIKTRFEENDSLWAKSTVKERIAYIESMALTDYKAKGYLEVTGLTHAQAYNEKENKFIMVKSFNPLYSGKGEKPKTIADIDDDDLKECLKLCCAQIRSNTERVKNVSFKNKEECKTGSKTVKCSGNGNIIVLVIPEDDGLKEKFKKIISEIDTFGVEFDIVSSYGKGASGQYVEDKKGE